MSRRNIELNALLDVTQAINANIPEEHLYKVFFFTCISNLQLSEVALFVLEGDRYIEKFSHSIAFTTGDLEMFQKHGFESDKIKAIHPHISQVFPVHHKDKLLAVLILGKHNEEELKESYSFLKTISNIVLIAIENKRLVREALKQERYKKEVEIARNVQEMLIPSNLPNNSIINVAATYLPHLMVGGDYYDVIKKGDNYVFCIADVSGKGVAAALIMSNFQACLRALCKVTDDIEEIARDLNSQLIESAKSNHFVTGFIALFNVSTNTLSYVNAGHNPPILLKNKKEYVALDQGCYMFGVFDDLPEIIKHDIQIETGDKLFLYTDGITETMDNDGDEFGEDRLIEFLKATKDDELKMNLADLIIAVDEFKEDQDYRDDLTMLSIKFL
jgi:sigma-B regulation protein RsbU (phosphoserine phosphatase)